MDEGRDVNDPAEQERLRLQILAVWNQPWVREERDGSAIVQLTYPVVTKEQSTAEIRIRRLKGRDMKHLPGNGMGLTLQQVPQFLHTLCDSPRHVIDELDAVDLLRASEVLAAFFLPGPGTGAR